MNMSNQLTFQPTRFLVFVQIRVVLLLALFCWDMPFLFGQQIIADQEAPKINFAQYLLAEKEGFTTSDKNILLDFWFTGCKPCIASVPRLNEIVNTYGEDQLVVISVNSYDSINRISAFLQQHHLNTHIAVDLEKKIHHAFNISILPTAVLIDRKNQIRWKGTVDQVDDAFLQSFLQEDIIKNDPLAGRLIYTMDLRYAADRTISSVSFETGEKFGFSWINKTAAYMIGGLVDFLENDTTKYFVTGEGPTTAYDFSFSADSAQDQNQVFTKVLENLSLPLGYTIEGKRQRVWALKISDKTRLQKTISEDQSRPPAVNKEGALWVKAANIKISDLVQFLRHQMALWIEPDISDTMGYDFNMPVSKDLAVIQEFLKKHGLQLTRREQQVHTVHINFLHE